MLGDKDDEVSAVNTLGLDTSPSSSDMTLDNEQQQQQNDDNISQAVSEASVRTGLKSELCKHILYEFDKIKRQRVNIQSHEHQSSYLKK